MRFHPRPAGYIANAPPQRPVGSEEEMMKIGGRDVILLCIGGVAGFLLCFAPTGSIIAASTAGIASGMGGICIVLIFERWLNRRQLERKNAAAPEK